MAASGVIAITAQIMESADIEGAEENPSSGPPKSFMQRLKANLKGLKSGWKNMSKIGGTGLFFLMLSQSKIAGGIVKNMFQIVGTLVDLLLDNFGIIRFLSWMIPKLSTGIQKIGAFIDGIGPTFKKIWGVVWDWISTLASSSADTLLDIFKNIKPSEVSSEEVEELFEKRVLQLEAGETIVTEADKQAFLAGTAEAKLIDEPVFTQEEVEDYAEHYRGQMQTEMDNVRKNAEMDTPDIADKQWYHEGGGDLPGGQVTSDHVDAALESGEIVLIDEKLDEGNDTLISKTEDAFASWFDDIGSFQWSDLTGLFSVDKLNPKHLMDALFFGTSSGTTPKNAMDAILERSVLDDFPKNIEGPSPMMQPDESQHGQIQTSQQYAHAYLDQIGMSHIKSMGGTAGPRR